MYEERKHVIHDLAMLPESYLPKLRRFREPLHCLNYPAAMCHVDLSTRRFSAYASQQRLVHDSRPLGRLAQPYSS